ncbi:MAG: bifunctional oligoribonuclease/PAP phosphatase NrnA [Treponema sp.]|nr:bifunctional oligoribonuclease/PAP phosphatase NrnA [Treponema sp.]
MTLITQEQAENFRKFILNHNYFFVVGHKEPDGDCIASCLGIQKILKNLGRSCQLLSAGPFKRIEIKKYENLFTSEMDFLTDSERKKAGLIICDCSELSRLGDIDGDLTDLDTFIIDHHKTADVKDKEKAIIDPQTPAASLLVQQIFELLGGELDENIASVLYFGTMTDTGFFRFLSSNDSDALICISRLVKAGADPRKTYDLITSGKSWQTRKLLGVMLDHAKPYLDGKLIVTYETMEDTWKYGQDGRDSDALYQALLCVKGVEAVAFVRQETEYNCTAGLRSKDNVDVSIVASKFGGGGHKNASGLSTEGKLDTLIPSIVKEFARIM